MMSPGDWKPIATAEKGCLALVYANGLVGSALLTERGWINVSVGASGGPLKPSHWMELRLPAEQSERVPA